MVKLFVILLSFLSFANAQTWQNIGPFYGLTKKGDSLHSMGLVQSFVQHPANPSIILMGSNASGIWKTTNSGIDWENVTSKEAIMPGMGISSLSINPNNSNEVICGVSNTVYGDDSYQSKILKSIDFGSTWKEVETFKNPDWNGTFVKVSYLDDKTILAATSVRIMLSKDNGEHWQDVFHLNKKYTHIDHEAQTIVDYIAFDEKNILVTASQKWGSSAQIWQTSDGGATWRDIVKQSTLPNNSLKKVFSAKLSEQKEGKAILSITDTKKVLIYEAQNRGASFKYLGAFNTTYQTGDAKGSKFEVAYSKVDNGKLYFGFIEFFEWSKTGGLKMLSPNANISASEHDDVRSMNVILDQNGKEYVLMGNDGGLSKYYPLLKKFKSLNGLNLPTVQVYNMGISQNEKPNILIGTQDNGTFEFSSIDNKWYWIAGGDGGASWLSNKGTKQFYSANASITFETKGERKKQFYSPNKNRSGWFLDYPVEMKPNEQTIVFGSKKRNNSKGATLYFHNTSPTKGSSSIEIEKMGKIGEIEIHDADSELIYIAGGDYTGSGDNKPRLLKSIDGGQSFEDLSLSLVYTNDGSSISLNELLNYKTITDIEIDPLSKDDIYISISGYLEPQSWTKPWESYRVLYSYNGGETWEDYSNGLPTIPVHELIRHKGSKNDMFCGTDAGVYYKRNSSSRWRLFGESFPKNIAVSDLKINYCTNKLYASTYGRGVFTIDLLDNKRYKEQIQSTDSLTYTDLDIIPFDLRIGKKQTVTITNDLLLSKGAQIILAPKSKLIIDGATIARRCEDSLEIIKKEEKRFLFFFKRKRGKVEFLNNGKIEE